ncbi:MAG: hypothetical protein ACLQO7_05535 [Candidatus Bathyarchaeia archaeon]
MRKRMVTIGVVLLIVGIAFLVSGVIGLRGSTNTVKVFNQPNPGEYVSSEILFNSSSTIIVRSPPSVGGLIPALYINLVNSTNIVTYEAEFPTAVAGAVEYNSIQGNYYYVIFSSTQPNTRLAITGSLGTTAALGLLTLAGIVFIIIGIILAILGAFRKPKGQRKKDEYEYKYPEPVKT